MLLSRFLLEDHCGQLRGCHEFRELSTCHTRGLSEGLRGVEHRLGCRDFRFNGFGDMARSIGAWFGQGSSARYDATGSGFRELGQDPAEFNTTAAASPSQLSTLNPKP